MGRPRKTREQYQRLPEVRWTELSNGNYHRGAMSVKPNVEMLLSDYRKLIINEDAQQERFVIYDQDYVFQYYTQDLLERLGFIDDNDDINEDTLWEFIAELMEYAKSKRKKAKLNMLKGEAMRMAEQYPHMNEEEWLAVLTGRRGGG